MGGLHLAFCFRKKKSTIIAISSFAYTVETDQQEKKKKRKNKKASIMWLQNVAKTGFRATIKGLDLTPAAPDGSLPPWFDRILGSGPKSS